jgi:drug/metabolite transporter (DMT)-like permease
MFPTPTALREFYARVPPELRGMGMILLATFAFSGMHVVARQLQSELHAFEVAFFRNLFGLLALTPFFLRHGLGVLKTERLGLHALRGVIQVGCMLMFFSALALTPLAKVSAMSFTAPLFATLGAVLVLGERIRARRITALVLGFVGAMIILRPGIEAIDTGAILVLVSSAGWACAMLVIKHLSKTESSLTLTAYMGIFMTPLSLLAAVWFWRWPEPVDYLWFVAMGGLGSVAHLLMAQAFREADATAVLPLDFTRLIWASLLGFFIFGEIPVLWTWLGGSVIFASTTYIAYRETRLKGRGNTG